MSKLAAPDLSGNRLPVAVICPGAPEDSALLRHFLRYEERESHSILQGSAVWFKSLARFFVVCFAILFGVGVSGLGISVARGADFVIVVDQSGSMEKSPPHSDKLRVRYDAALLCIEFARATDRVALIDFTAKATDMLPLTLMDASAKTTAREAVQKSREAYTDGATNLLAALESAADVLETAGATDANREVVLLTDGIHTNATTEEKPLFKLVNGKPTDLLKPFEAVLNKLPKLGARVHVLSLGNQTDRIFSQYVAARTHGAPYEITEASKLLKFYVDILAASLWFSAAGVTSQFCPGPNESVWQNLTTTAASGLATLPWGQRHLTPKAMGWFGPANCRTATNWYLIC